MYIPELFVHTVNDLNPNQKEQLIHMLIFYMLRYQKEVQPSEDTIKINDMITRISGGLFFNGVDDVNENNRKYITPSYVYRRFFQARISDIIDYTKLQ